MGTCYLVGVSVGRACHLMQIPHTVSARQVHLTLGGPASTPYWEVLSRDHKTWGLTMWCGDAAVEGLPLHR